MENRRRESSIEKKQKWEETKQKRVWALSHFLFFIFLHLLSVSRVLRVDACSVLVFLLAGSERLPRPVSGCAAICLPSLLLSLSHYREAAHLAWHTLNLMHWLTDGDDNGVCFLRPQSRRAGLLPFRFFGKLLKNDPIILQPSQSQTGRSNAS